MVSGIIFCIEIGQFSIKMETLCSVKRGVIDDRVAQFPKMSEAEEGFGCASYKKETPSHVKGITLFPLINIFLFLSFFFPFLFLITWIFMFNS